MSEVDTYHGCPDCTCIKTCYAVGPGHTGRVQVGPFTWPQKARDWISDNAIYTPDWRVVEAADLPMTCEPGSERIPGTHSKPRSSA
jgi:hypothetical protein